MELQRHSLALAKSKVQSPTELETITFMLSALENVAAELEHCRQWGRSAGAEVKKKAGDRLALLLQNPNLVDKIR